MLFEFSEGSSVVATGPDYLGEFYFDGGRGTGKVVYPYWSTDILGELVVVKIGRRKYIFDPKHLSHI